jgi:hypothetical protein
MFNFSVDVFVTNPHSLQSHLRRQTGPAEAPKPDEKPFALFNVHFAAAPNNVADSLLLIYDQEICPPALLSDLAPRVHGVIQQNMRKNLTGMLVLGVLDRSLTAAGEPPKSFAIQRPVHTEQSDRYLLQEATEAGPIPNKEPSVVIEVFFVSPEQLSITMLILDERLFGENAAKGLLGWFVQSIKLEARAKTGVEWHNAKFLGFAKPQPAPGAGGPAAPVANA